MSREEAPEGQAGPTSVTWDAAARSAGHNCVLPMLLRIGDRLTDETGDYEIIGLPYTAQMGRNVHVSVKRVDSAEATMIRTYAAHERISVKRAG